MSVTGINMTGESCTMSNLTVTWAWQGMDELDMA